MHRTVLTLAAVLVATGSAFAGSDHYGASNAGQPAAAVDTTYTASIAKPEMARHDLTVAAKSAAEEPGQGIWGR